MTAARMASEGTIPIARKLRDPRYVWLDAVRNDPAVKSTEVRLAEVLVRDHLNQSGRARPSPCNETLAGKIYGRPGLFAGSFTAERSRDTACVVSP